PRSQSRSRWHGSVTREAELEQVFVAVADDVDGDVEAVVAAAFEDDVAGVFAVAAAEDGAAVAGFQERPGEALVLFFPALEAGVEVLEAHDGAGGVLLDDDDFVEAGLVVGHPAEGAEHG